MLGFVVGSAAQLSQAVLWPAHGYLALMLVGVAIQAGVVRWAGGIVVARYAGAMLALCLVGFAIVGWRASLRDVLPAEFEGKDVVVTGTVASLPTQFDRGVRFRFQVDTAHLDGRPVTLPTMIDLAWYATGQGQHPTAVRPSTTWTWCVRLKAPHGAVNPLGEDEELRWWQAGVRARGYVRQGRNDPPPQYLGESWRHPVERLRGMVRQRILHRLGDMPSARIAAALVVGDQSLIDREDWDAFRATGVSHLMSISGVHVTMFAWMAALLVGSLWRRSPWLCLRWSAPVAAQIGGLVLAAAYALFSGWAVPAQRTVLMLCTVVLLRLLGRSWPWPMVWLGTLTVVVAADPWVLRQAGFWLSFVAVAMLFATRQHGDPAATLLQRTRALVREQGVVTLTLSPLTLVWFGQCSLVGLLANLLAIPWVTLLVTPLAMVGVVVEPAWNVCAMALDLLTGTLHAMAQWPMASLTVARAPTWVGAVAVCAGGWMAMRLPWHWRALGVAPLLPVLLWQAPRPPMGEFELLAADVGQGSAVLVRTAHHALLYDAGPRYGTDFDAGQRVLVPLLHALGERLDRIVLSHADSDHTGGAVAITQMQPQAVVLSSADALPGVAATMLRCQAGQRWHWDGVDFEMLAPTASEYATTAKPNARSCVLRIATGQHSALLTGDIEARQEALLAQRIPPLRSTVLLVPHHGGASSSSMGFVQAVQPRIALVQAGYRNRFGHPVPAVVARYAQAGATVRNTALCGALTWRSADPDAEQCQRETNRRYWHHRPGGAGIPP
nr:DNA internalization-related competence protein ComEC/Rec2 [Candidatus Symbiobacter mobilis]